MLQDFKLKVFMEVARKRSFTLAAKALGITQPAVSQNISELEKELGTVLVDRSGRAVKLTAAGLVFEEYASRILYWYSAAGSMFGPEGKLASGRPLRIVSDSFASNFIMPGLILNLHASNPGLPITLSDGNAGNEDADAVVSSCPHEAEPSLESSVSFVGSVRAIAVTSNPAYSDAGSLGALPPGVRYAVWKGYSGQLPPDIEALAVLLSDNLIPVLSLAGRSPQVVGIVPAACRGTAVFPDSASGPMAGTADPFQPAGRLSVISVPVPGLATDVHFRPSASFSSSPLCSFVRGILGRLLEDF